MLMLMVMPPLLWFLTATLTAISTATCQVSVWCKCLFKIRLDQLQFINSVVTLVGIENERWWVLFALFLGFVFICYGIRQRELRALVRDTPRRTPAAVVAERCHSTSRRPLALLADTLAPRLDHVLIWLSIVCLILNFLLVEWGQKAKRRSTTGTGRMRYLKDLPRRFKNGFREGMPSIDYLRSYVNFVLGTVAKKVVKA